MIPGTVIASIAGQDATSTTSRKKSTAPFGRLLLPLLRETFQSLVVFQLLRSRLARSHLNSQPDAPSARPKA